MSSSSPADLAVTFRSIARRLREAQGEAPPAATSAPTAELHALVDRAARLMGSGRDATAVADAIDGTSSREWDDTRLGELRSIALDIGQLLRAIAAIADDDDGPS